MREVEKEERIAELRRDLRERLREEHSKHTKRIGRHKYVLRYSAHMMSLVFALACYVLT